MNAVVKAAKAKARAMAAQAVAVARADLENARRAGACITAGELQAAQHKYTLMVAHYNRVISH